MSIKLLTEHRLEFVSLKGPCTGSYESTHVKMPHCWKSHAMAHIGSDKKRILQECSCFIEFIKQVGEKR